MQLEDYFDVLDAHDIRVKGTRVGIETILYDFIHREEAPETIAARYPSLNLEQVYATITYYLHNKAQMEAYLATWLEHGRQMRERQSQAPTPAMARLRAARQRRTASVGS